MTAAVQGGFLKIVLSYDMVKIIILTQFYGFQARIFSSELDLFKSGGSQVCERV